MAGNSTTTISLSLAAILSGVRQEDAFARGRALSISNTRARLAPATAAVRREIDLDKIRQFSARGRAGRISRILRISFRSDLLPETHRRWIARILAGLDER